MVLSGESWGWGVQSDIWVQFTAYTNTWKASRHHTYPSLHTQSLSTLGKIKLLNLEFAIITGNLEVSWSMAIFDLHLLQRAVSASSELMSNCCFWACLDFPPPQLCLKNFKAHKTCLSTAVTIFSSQKANSSDLSLKGLVQHHIYNFSVSWFFFQDKVNIASLSSTIQNWISVLGCFTSPGLLRNQYLRKMHFREFVFLNI